MCLVPNVLESQSQSAYDEIVADIEEDVKMEEELQTFLDELKK